MTIRALTPEDWPTITRLFGENGACGGCWCMWWRVPRGGKLWESAKGRRNRDGLRRRVKAGDVHAVVAFAGGEPVGWCSFGPRATFPRLETVRALRGEWSAETWSIVCFFIPPLWRRRGLGSRLLAAATDRAFSLGAREVQGYPVEPKSDAMPGAFAWTGVPPVFAAAGFRPLPAGGATRAIWVRRR